MQLDTDSDESFNSWVHVQGSNMAGDPCSKTIHKEFLMEFLIL